MGLLLPESWQDAQDCPKNQRSNQHNNQYPSENFFQLTVHHFHFLRLFQRYQSLLYERGGPTRKLLATLRAFPETSPIFFFANVSVSATDIQAVAPHSDHHRNPKRLQGEVDAENPVGCICNVPVCCNALQTSKKRPGPFQCNTFHPHKLVNKRQIGLIYRCSGV